MCRPAGPEPVRAVFEISFEDWLQYQLERRLHHSVAHRRNTQRPQLSIWLGDVNPQHRLGAIGFVLQALLDFVQKRGLLLGVGRYLFDTHSIHARSSSVAPYCRPRAFQHVAPIHQCVETVEAKPLLLFGFPAQLLSQLTEARRQNRFRKGQLLRRLFCRRSLHFNQLPLPLTRLDSGQGSLAPSRLDRDFTATMSPSDTASRPRQRLWLPVVGCPRRTPSRVSQVPAGSFGTRCLLSPRGIRSVPSVVSSRTDVGFAPIRRVGHSHVCNEAEPSSRTATARTFAPLGFSEQGRPRRLRDRLHDFRPIIMTNSFQLTRTCQARLALSRWTQMNPARQAANHNATGSRLHVAG